MSTQPAASWGHSNPGQLSRWKLPASHPLHTTPSLHMSPSLGSKDMSSSLTSIPFLALFFPLLRRKKRSYIYHTLCPKHDTVNRSVNSSRLSRSSIAAERSMAPEENRASGRALMWCHSPGNHPSSLWSNKQVHCEVVGERKPITSDRYLKSSYSSCPALSPNFLLLKLPSLS